MLMLSNMLLVLSGKLEMPKTQIPVYTRTLTRAIIHLLLYEVRQMGIVKGRLKAKPCSSPYNKKEGGLEGCVHLGGGGWFSPPNNRFIRDISPSQCTACSRFGDNLSALIKAGFDGSDFLLRFTFFPLLVSSELSDGIMKAMLSFSDGVHFKLELCSPLFFFFT